MNETPSSRPPPSRAGQAGTPARAAATPRRRRPAGASLLLRARLAFALPRTLRRGRDRTRVGAARRRCRLPCHRALRRRGEARRPQDRASAPPPIAHVPLFGPRLVPSLCSTASSSMTRTSAHSSAIAAGTCGCGASPTRQATHGRSRGSVFVFRKYKGTLFLSVHIFGHLGGLGGCIRV